ncbi:hypothetical protein D3C87_2062250 [compost metagenome]
MSLIGLGADESKIEELLGRKAPSAEERSTEEVNNVEGNADFAGLLGAIEGNKE